MQFDSIVERSSYSNFLQCYQAALGNHMLKTPRYVYLFFIFQFTLVLFYIRVFFQTKSMKTYTVLILYCFFCTIFSLIPTYSLTLDIKMIQSGLSAWHPMDRMDAFSWWISCWWLFSHTSLMYRSMIPYSSFVTMCWNCT